MKVKVNVKVVLVKFNQIRNSVVRLMKKIK